MESQLDLLIKEVKNENTVPSYLRLYQFYRSSQKYFSAQQTLERCLQNMQLDLLAPVEDEFSTRLYEITSSHSDIKKPALVYNSEAFIIYSLLGDVTLVLKEPLDAIVWFFAACKNYREPTPINQRLKANVVYCGLIQCFMSIMMQFLYKKEYKAMMAWKLHTDWLIEYIKSSGEYAHTSDKLEMMIGNYYFILFSWYSNPSDFELCEKHIGNLPNIETKFILAYYRNKTEAKALVKELVMNNPGISIFWTWLSLVEEDYERKCNAVNKALHLDKKNWTAWVALGIIQASHGDFIRAAKTWKIAHHVNHLDPKLWVLSAFLYKEAKMEAKSVESFKLACDLDPCLWISIEHYLATS